MLWEPDDGYRTSDIMVSTTINKKTQTGFSHPFSLAFRMDFEEGCSHPTIGHTWLGRRKLGYDLHPPYSASLWANLVREPIQETNLSTCVLVLSPPSALFLHPGLLSWLSLKLMVAIAMALSPMTQELMGK